MNSLKWLRRTRVDHKLIYLAYDSTNGTISAGDIIRSQKYAGK